MSRVHPELRELLTEASRALARLDTERLEELALSCQALKAGAWMVRREDAEVMARQTRDAAKEMAIFGRVLDATRANLEVMRRIRELRAGRLEYGERQLAGWSRAGIVDGHH